MVAPPRALARSLLAAFALCLGLAANPALAQTPQPVTVGNAIIPAPGGGTPLAVGESFRLLFVTTATSTDIGVYNTFVQTSANGGHDDIQGFSDQFLALASTNAVNARENTRTKLITEDGTADPNIPIYWLLGDQVSDNNSVVLYGAFGWDSQSGRDESGNTHAPARIWTGTTNRGSGGSFVLGASSPRFGVLATFEELQSNGVTDSSGDTLADATAPMLLTATVNGDTLTLTYDEALTDTPVPAMSDYIVMVNMVTNPVTTVVISNNKVTLTLTREVVAGNMMTITYTAGTNPVQDAAAIPVAGITEPMMVTVISTPVFNGDDAADQLNRAILPQAAQAIAANTLGAIAGRGRARHRLVVAGFLGLWRIPRPRGRQRDARLGRRVVRPPLRRRLPSAPRCRARRRGVGERGQVRLR